MALAGAADSLCTLELVDELRQSRIPKLPIWGQDDTFQPISYAERLADEMPETQLIPIASAGHIPMENDPQLVATALADFFTA